jgi:hypothetical protein
VTKTIDEMADIVEFQVWASQKGMTLSELTDQLEAALDADEKLEAEGISQNVLDEFRHRQGMLGVAYPFVTDGYRIELNHPQPTRTTYLFCLGLSLLPPSQIQNEQRCIQFETVVVNAAKNFFGGDAIRIGAPWHSDEVQNYGALLDRVIELIPNLGKKIKTAAPDGRDAGWDVLVVKNFCDNRIPRFVALGNCATGRTDWKRKGMETQPTLFWSYFQGQRLSAFMTFFAVPFIMDEESRLRKLSDTILTFDRFRICEHAPVIPIAATTDWLEGQRNNAQQIPLN